MPEPTGRDAELYVKLLGITQSDPHAAADAWVNYEFQAASHAELEEKYKPGSEERQKLVLVMGFYEAAGVLVSRGLLHEDVFFDSPFHFGNHWPKLRTIIEEWQKAADNPDVWENFYWLGLRFEAWRKDRWKAKLELVPPDRGPLEPEAHVTGFSR
jgi:hypothetical protein